MNLEATFDKCDPKTGEVIAKYKNFSLDEVFAQVNLAQDVSKRWQEFGFTARKRTLLKWVSDWLPSYKYVNPSFPLLMDWGEALKVSQLFHPAGWQPHQLS